MTSKKFQVKRGDVYYADLSPVIGSEQGGIRPVVVIQNDMGNKYSPTTIIAPITSRSGKSQLPTHVEVAKDDINGLETDSIILLEQVRTVDKKRLKEHVGHVSAYVLKKINDGLKISLQM